MWVKEFYLSLCVMFLSSKINQYQIEFLYHIRGKSYVTSIFDDYRLPPFLHSHKVWWRHVMSDNSIMLFISCQFLRRLFVYLLGNKYHVVEEVKSLDIHSICPHISTRMSLSMLIVMIWIELLSCSSFASMLLCSCM